MIKQLPVPEIKVLYNEVYVDLEHVALRTQPKLPLQDGPPGVGGKHNAETPEHVEDGQRAKDAEPEPQENVDLLVDYVDWQDTLI